MLLKGAGKAATEPILKELAKHLRNGLVDKALVMRIACAQVIWKVDKGGWRYDSLTYQGLVYASRYSKCSTKLYSS